MISHSAQIDWFPFIKGACQMTSPFKGILLFSKEWERFCKKLLSVTEDYYHIKISPKTFFTRVHTRSGIWVFFIGPKDMVNPVQARATLENAWQSGRSLSTKVWDAVIVCIFWINHQNWWLHEKFWANDMRTNYKLLKNNFF